MGVGNNSAAIYLSIVNGKVARRFKEKTPDSVTRTTEKGNVVHEELYSYVEGDLMDIAIRDNGYGKQWQITIVDEKDTFILNLPYSSGYARGFLFSVPNADLSKPIRFSPWAKEVEPGKKKTAMYLSQGKDQLEWAYTKDNPNGLPQLKQIKVKGETIWDDTDQLDFMEAVIAEEILPALRKLGHKEPKEKERIFEAPISVEAEEVFDKDDDIDSLPF